MKLGLITDIHEHVVNLKAALDALQKQQVDQIVVIGDLLEMGQRIEETCKLLADAKVIGVWGNHDFGLCGDDVHPDYRMRYSPAVFDYLNTLCARLVVKDCYFAHIEPWLNPEDIVDLWYFDGVPDSKEKLDRIFKNAPNRIMFAGHYHRWLAATPSELLDWNGERPLRLDQGPHFVVINALCEGSFATFDTVTSELVPYQL